MPFPNELLQSRPVKKSPEPLKGSMEKVSLNLILTIKIKKGGDSSSPPLVSSSCLKSLL